MSRKNRPFDFCGWATVNDVKCSDGRTIRRNAFVENDGEEVPLVWQHLHNDPENVLGHALLENHDEGVYCYAWFNNNPKAQAAKEAAANGDIKALSIYANQLVQRGNDVVHGQIREVSMVLTGANKGARIENLNFAHSDGTYDRDDEEALIYTDEQLIELYHNDGNDPEEDYEDDDEAAFEYDDEEEPEDDAESEYDDEEPEEDDAEYADEDPEDAVEEEYEEEPEEDQEMDIQDVLNGMTDEQLEVVNALYEQGQIDALQDVVDDMEDDLADEEEDEEEEYEDEDEDDEVAHSMYGGYDSMKRNVFDNDPETTAEENTLSHAETEQIFADAKRMGSLKESFLAHSDEYGIKSIDYATKQAVDTNWLFPDYRGTSAVPEFIKRDQGWVTKVMSAIHHTPFTRIKSTFADITADEARALGYIKGNRKKEEVFTVLRRTTDPQTIYKKQKLDRDDVVDITDFDVVAWIKGEMRMMLDEEIARAILIGDGRAPDSPDKINQLHVRSIWQDDDLFAVKCPVTAVTGEDFAKTTVKTIIRNRKNYKGSGNPVFFTTEDVLTEMLLLEDGMGHFMYKTVAELATQLRVREIVTVPVMENAGTRTETKGNVTKVYDLLGIVVNLDDYNVGADKGGSVNMFDDFDIDYNQQKYLIETRISGALTKPFSALVIEKEHEGT